MTSSYPLYEILCNRIIAKGGVVDPDPNLLRNYMQSLTVEQSLHITVLMLSYYYYSISNVSIFSKENCTSRARKPVLPYGMIVDNGGKGFKIDINELPVGLRAIIWEYCIE